jgi:hypothetical protein
VHACVASQLVAIALRLFAIWHLIPFALRCVQILTILVMRFPKQLGPFLNGIVPQVWNSLVSALAMCVTQTGIQTRWVK